MRGKVAKAIRRAVERTYQVGVLPLHLREYHYNTKTYQLINSPGTGRDLVQKFKRHYKRGSYV